jgi:alpha-N-acetylglucosamine transferase
MYLVRNVHKSIYPFVLLVTDRTPNNIKEIAVQKYNAQIIKVNPKLTTNKYYEQVMTKLYAFNLYEYNRVIITDSDQLILQNLDELFELPKVDIAMPRAYWIDKGFGASTLMTIIPSHRIWNRILIKLENLEPKTYDMDVVNQIFGNEILMLPPKYITLNSHWEVNKVPGWSTEYQKTLENNKTIPQALSYLYHFVLFISK